MNRIQVVVALVGLGLAACTGTRADERAVPTPPEVADPASPKSTAIVGSFDVGGRDLWLDCEGSGSPTIVYFHGMMGDDAIASGADHAAPIAPYLTDDYRFCAYDRANVGRSDPVPGKQTAIDAVHDLHALLAAAHVPGPYVLLGASFGGLVAYEYAVTYPQGIEGMVVLDPTLPREYLDIDPYYLDPDEWLTGDEWKDVAESMDWLGSMQETQKLEGQEPTIPLTYIAIKHPDYWWKPVTPESVRAYRAMQQRFADLWSPGKMLIVDTPHYMEPEIPGRIAKEVRGVIAEAEGS
jgi:pimeloyl-ACP methyl ester carboxylesterase